ANPRRTSRGQTQTSGSGGADLSFPVAAHSLPQISSAEDAASERPTAIATLNRQRHLTPSCGGLALPRREQWTRQGYGWKARHPDPELENNIEVRRTCRAGRNTSDFGS